MKKEYARTIRLTQADYEYIDNFNDKKSFNQKLSDMIKYFKEAEHEKQEKVKNLTEDIEQLEQEIKLKRKILSELDVIINTSCTKISNTMDDVKTLRKANRMWW